MTGPLTRSGQQLPTGTVTFLYTDIEGSTRRWEQSPDAMKAAVERHDVILRNAIESNGGVVFRTMGDAFCAAFLTAPQALSAALAAQRALQDELWGQGTGPVKVRMALHTGMGDIRDGDYVGPHLNRIARLLSTGYGGQTLLSQATYTLIRDLLATDTLPPRVAVRDLGEHRLKDLQNSEHIYQVVVPGLPADFPPLKTLDYRPNNLPPQPTPFIGRDKEVAEVQTLLLGPDARLVTLLGPGGMGKSRLSVEVGAGLLDEFEDGVFFVSLSAISDAGLVASQIAQTLGIRETGGLSIIASLKDYLRDKQILLLLDNFEQVVDAAALVAELIAAAPQLRVLVTSREVLHLQGEQVFPVPPMSLPPVGAQWSEAKSRVPLPSVSELSKYEAIALFVQRGQLVKPGFEITEQNASAIVEICIKLDGLPLALELAAARIRLLSPEAMLGRLDSKLKLLTGGARDLPERQQTLRSTIEWSYDLLDPGEQMLFRRLAVFVGGCTLEAAEAVCDVGNRVREWGEGIVLNPTPSPYSLTPLELDVLDGLASLSDKSLLRSETSGEGGDGGESRFRMLEMVREYGLWQLVDSSEGGVVRRAHAEYYLGLVEEIEPKLSGPEQAAWLDKLETEHGNIRAALEWGISEDIDIALRVAGALLWFWDRRSHLSEGQARLTALLARPEASKHSTTRAKALLALGRLAVLRGDYTVARTAFEENLQIWRELGDNRGTGHALIALGSAATAEGDYATARALYEEGLAIERGLGDRSYTAMALVGLGEAMINQDDYERATPAVEESLELFKTQGNDAGTGFSLLLLGQVAYHGGDYGRATMLFKESLVLRSKLENKQSVAQCLLGLAEVACALDRADHAARLLGAAQSLLEAAGARISAADQARFERDLARARAQLGEAAWEKAWNEGRAMTIEQAAAYALAS